MKLSDIVAAYVSNQPAGIVLDDSAISRLLKKAVRFYCGYATIRSVTLADGVTHTPIDATNSISGGQDFDLSPSEYGIIRPLFDLYVEAENAMNLEASRGLGVDVFGRQVSEIQQEIRQYETDLPRLAFVEPLITI